MIVRILSSSAAFHGVSYNTDKVDRGLGELMTVANFGVLQGLHELRPEDYKNELKAIAALNKRVKSPQFHAAISAPGKTFDKDQLTAIAIKWLAEMGYAKQPYLIIFHKDTANNHVHIVSNRIDRNGKKINRDFEHIRAVQQLNKIMGLDEKQNVTLDIEKALGFRFTTVAQFKMILEHSGYSLKEENNQLQVIKFGTKLADLPLQSVTRRLAGPVADDKRPAQLKAILLKYAKVYDTNLRMETIPLPGRSLRPTGNFTSDLAQYLKDKHGLMLKFHASLDKPPYGYSLIDLVGKGVYKGSQIMPLKELLATKHVETLTPVNQPPELLKNADSPLIDYYGSLLKAIIHNYPDIRQGLHHQGLVLKYAGGDLILIDFSANISIPVNALIGPKEYEDLQQELGRENETTGELQRQYHAIPSLNLASDIDDEAIHGRNRHRKKKARTNTR